MRRQRAGPSTLCSAGAGSETPENQSLPPVLQTPTPSPPAQAAETVDRASPRPTSRRRGPSKTDAPPPALDGKLLKDVQASFAHLDTNHDGLLSLEEFATGLGLLSMNAEFATIIFNAFDKSGDGMIDRREFVATIGVMLHPEDMERQVCFFPSSGTAAALCARSASHAPQSELGRTPSVSNSSVTHIPLARPRRPPPPPAPAHHGAHSPPLHPPARRPA